MPKPKILITGATGLVGGTLITTPKLFQQFEVHATYRATQLTTSSEVSWHQLDFVQNKSSISELVQSIRPNVIIHCAAESHVDRCSENLELCEELNVTIARELALQASEINSFFIHLSSDFVFSGKESPYAEMDEFDPVNDYGYTKVKSEHEVLKVCSNTAIVRPVQVYGVVPTLNRGNLLTWVVGALKKGQTIRVVKDQYRMPTAATDLAFALIQLATKKYRGIFHLSGGETYTIYEFAVKIAEHFGLPTSLIEPISSEELGEKNPRPPDTAFKLKKSKYLLDFNPKPLEFHLDYYDNLL